MSKRPPELQGKPTFTLAGFNVWVLGREFDDAQDPSDDNWLRVVAQCGAQGAEVRVSGAILELAELRAWLDELLALQTSKTGAAELACTEPYLRAQVKFANGRGTFALEITPDPLTQQHKFSFDIDHSQVSKLTSSLETLLMKFPLRGQT